MEWLRVCVGCSARQKLNVAAHGDPAPSAATLSLSLARLEPSAFLKPLEIHNHANTMPYRQRYSHYLPLKRHSSRTASRPPSLVKDGTKSPREKESRSARNSSVTNNGKRRSTMNSREAGYNEAEALRRAIEASKEDAPDPADGSTRRAKRGRSDSEENVSDKIEELSRRTHHVFRKPESAKRQRTGSESVSPAPDKTADDSDSDEALSSVRNGLSKTKSRNGADRARSSRTEKPAERDERERQRVEAANKRKGRAERRRIDGTFLRPIP